MRIHLLALGLALLVIASSAKAVPSTVPVALIDNDFDFEHESLTGHLFVNEKEIIDGIDNDGNGYIDDRFSYDVETKTGNTRTIEDENCGHGTMLADIITRPDRNIKATAIRISNKVFAGFLNPENAAAYSELLSVSKLALRRGIRVVNGSLGMSETFVRDFVNNTGHLTETEITKRARLAVKKWREYFETIVSEFPNTLFVFGAGNEGQDNDREPTFPCSIKAPNVICVANASRNEKGLEVSLEESSNFGLKTVDVAAFGATPQAACAGTKNKYGAVGGTSAAAAKVSSLAAQIILKHPKLPPAKIRELIVHSAHVYPTLKGKIRSAGVIAGD